MRSKVQHLFLLTLLSSTILAGCDGKPENKSTRTFGSGTNTDIVSNVVNPPDIVEDHTPIPVPVGPSPSPAPAPVEEAKLCASSLPVDGWETAEKLRYHVSAVSEKVVRVRIGKNTLPKDASWAVLPESRKALPCDALTDAGYRGLKTNSIQVEASQDNKLTIRNNEGVVLWEDATRPKFEVGGNLEFSGTIPSDSQFYGLGDVADSIDKSGKKYLFWTKSSYGFKANETPIYKAIPYFIRHVNGTYTGYFLDNTWRTSFDFGKAQEGVFTATADGGIVDLYVISGSSPKEVTKNYAALTGTTPLPNLWSLGWQQSKFGYTCGQIAEVANSYRKEQIPNDVMWFDIDFQDNNFPFTVANNFKTCRYRDSAGVEKTADFKGIIQYLSDQSMRSVVIADLHIAARTTEPQSGAPYRPYTEGLAGDYFIKNPLDNTRRPALNTDGTSNIKAQVWPWQSGVPTLSVFPDFTYRPAMDWWGTLTREFYINDNVAGFWNDMNEPDIFTNAPGYISDAATPELKATLDPAAITRVYDPEFGFEPLRTTTMHETHNVLGMLNSRGTFEGLKKLKSDQRPFVMTRASYVGGQRYAVTWTGDNSSTWQDLRMATNQLSSLGLAGFQAGADIGGFTGTKPTPELLTRWIQIGSFYPVARDHYEKPKAYLSQEPYANGTAAHFDSRKKYIRNRYALMPYLYTLAEEMERTGIPMMRRMFLEYPNARAPGDAKKPIDVAAETQFMVGSNLLVAPSPIEQGLVAPKPQPPKPAAVARPGTYIEAEDAVIQAPAMVEAEHAGFTGTGFVGGYHLAGDPRITFRTAGFTAGEYELQLRYANGEAAVAARKLSVSVNGGTAVGFTLPRTGAWTTYSTTKVKVQLTEGENIISVFRAAGDDGRVNIDTLAITAVGGTFPAVTQVVESPFVEEYNVNLPGGAWYDYWTGKKLESKENDKSASWVYTVERPTKFDIPVFVRAGAILPKVPSNAVSGLKSTQDVQQIEQLELVVYPGENCSGSIYVDDGTSFKHADGEFYRRQYTCSQDGKQLVVNFGDVVGDFKPSWTSVNVQIAGSTNARIVPETRSASSVSLTLTDQ